MNSGLGDLNCNRAYDYVELVQRQVCWAHLNRNWGKLRASGASASPRRVNGYRVFFARLFEECCSPLDLRLAYHCSVKNQKMLSGVIALSSNEMRQETDPDEPGMVWKPPLTTITSCLPERMCFAGGENGWQFSKREGLT
jgi:hypothetical protein